MLKVICDHCEGVLNTDGETVTVTLSTPYGQICLSQHSCDRDVLYIVKNALAKAQEYNSRSGLAIMVAWGRPVVMAKAIEGD